MALGAAFPTIHSISNAVMGPLMTSQNLIRGSELKKGRSQFLFQAIHDWSALTQNINIANYFFKSANFQFQIPALATLAGAGCLFMIYKSHDNNLKEKIHNNWSKANAFVINNLFTILNISAIAFSILTLAYATPLYSAFFIGSLAVSLNEYYKVIPDPILSKIIKNPAVMCIMNVFAATNNFILIVNAAFLILYLGMKIYDNKNIVNDFINLFKTKNKFDDLKLYNTDLTKLDDIARINGKAISGLPKDLIDGPIEDITNFLANIELNEGNIQILSKNLENDPLIEELLESQNIEAIKTELNRRLNIVIASSTRNQIVSDFLSKISGLLTSDASRQLKDTSILYLALEGNKCAFAQYEALRSAVAWLACGYERSKIELGMSMNISLFEDTLIGLLLLKMKTEEWDPNWLKNNDRHTAGIIKILFYPDMSGIEQDPSNSDFNIFVNKISGVVLKLYLKILSKLSTYPELAQYNPSSVINFLYDQIINGSIAQRHINDYIINFANKHFIEEAERDAFLHNYYDNPEKGIKGAIALVLKDMKYLKF